jgi:hypothetical protein
MDNQSQSRSRCQNESRSQNPGRSLRRSRSRCLSPSHKSIQSPTRGGVKALVDSGVCFAKTLRVPELEFLTMLQP